MKTSISLLAFILLLSLAGNYIQWNSAKQQSNYRDQENYRFQVEQKRKLTQIKARDSVIQALENKGVKDSIRHTSKQTWLTGQANALKAKVKKGPLILQDTIIVYLDSLVADLTNDRDTIRIDNRVKIDSLKSSLADLQGMWADQYKRAARFQADYDREKRKRWSIGINAGYGFKGPDVQVGIHYSILKF